MSQSKRTHRRARALAVCALVAALVAAVSAGFAATTPVGAAPASAPSASASPSSVLGTPSAPLKVTYKRSFTVTAPVVGDWGDATSATVECYREEPSGAWTRRGAAPATLRATDTAAPYVSAKVSFDTSGTWALRAVCGTVTPSASATSTQVHVNTRADHIIWNRDSHFTWPERMEYRRNARQMLVVTADSLGSHVGTLSAYEYRSGDWVKLFSSPCRLGRNALCDGTNRVRGNKKTPTGIWRMPDYVFGTHSKRLSGSKITHRHITNRSWWSAEKGSHYNMWVTTSRHVDGEHLADYPVEYEYALSTGYNALPNERVYGRGTGIFLHVWNGKTTSGCVSVPSYVMRRVFRALDPNVRRVFAVGTVKPSGATSIYAY